MNSNFMEYIFTATMLPTLKIGEPPEITFEELDTLLHDNLLAKDYEQIKTLRRLYDILNIRSFWKGEELDPYGNLNENELDEAVVDHVNLPSYVLQFLENNPSKETRLQLFSSLISLFFKEESKNAHGFLKTYLDFERSLQLVLTGFRAKKMNRNLEKELQFENPNEDLIAQILAQKDAPEFEPPEGFEDLKAIFEAYQDTPIKLYQALCEYRFDKIEEMIGSDAFSLSKILGYMAEFIIVDKWMHLNEKKGLEIVDTILKKSTGDVT